MTPKINVVGICGTMGAGKDTAADCLVHKRGFVKISLADPMKRFANQIFEFPAENLWGESSLRSHLLPMFTHEDSFSGWAKAYENFEEQAYDWVKEVVPDEKMVDEAYASLIHWVDWLHYNHQHLTARVLLQTIGTEWGRGINEALWFNYFMDVTKHLLKLDDNLTIHYAYDPRLGLYQTNNDAVIPGVVVSDLRFVNEVTFVKDKGGVVLKLVRPGYENSPVQLGISGHKSETEQQLVNDYVFSAIIDNDGSKADLEQDICTVVDCFIQ